MGKLEKATSRSKINRRRTSFWSWKVTPFGICVMLLLLGFGAGIWIPCVIPPRTISAAPACINYLRQIDTAKEQWARDNGKSYGDLVDEKGVSKYIKRGRPQCPAGGAYTYGRVGEDPTCSLGTGGTYTYGTVGEQQGYSIPRHELP